ncbi:hypothetical protein [Denitrificimonas caeni]|uniref:hypothetical protein n=1 Tax=Denitrificimonas caeni TaxID=521720 RepID=UPI001963B5F1|nr:hypothetical protein [Denitrificimonas caeni]
MGADGIRSAVRHLVLGDDASSLGYLDCIVILGICPLSALSDIDSDWLDSATVFQTANGHERIYIKWRFCCQYMCFSPACRDFTFARYASLFSGFSG